MLFLNTESLQYAVSMCSNNKNYNVYMVLSNDSLESTAQELNTMLVRDECKIRFTNINSVEVIFNNGSYMVLSPQNLANINGFKYDLLILDARCFDKIEESLLEKNDGNEISAFIDAHEMIMGHDTQK